MTKSENQKKKTRYVIMHQRLAIFWPLTRRRRFTNHSRITINRIIVAIWSAVYLVVIVSISRIIVIVAEYIVPATTIKRFR